MNSFNVYITSFGAPYADATASKGADVQPYKYNGKELDLMHGLNTYDYGARQHDPILARWDRIDPLSEKYYSTSPYAYCLNNPVNAIDPDGRYTKVIKRDDGTYEVVGGELDDDKNIYLYSQDKNGEYTVRGASIGQTACTTSFYDSDKGGAWQIGAIINPNDKSGQEFLDNIMSIKVTINNYKDNAGNGQPFDFKVTNGKGETRSDFYRGMQIVGHDGENVFVSARDVGNIAAGYMCKKNRIPWSLARKKIDEYQNRNSAPGNWKPEGMSTQLAQRYGYDYKISPIEQLNHLGYTIGSLIIRKIRGK